MTKENEIIKKAIEYGATYGTYGQIEKHRDVIIYLNKVTKTALRMIVEFLKKEYNIKVTYTKIQKYMEQNPPNEDEIEKVKQKFRREQ